MFQAKLLGSKTFDSNSLSAEITFHQNVFLDPWRKENNTNLKNEDELKNEDDWKWW